jgi:trk system potassium uptake protein TrkH
MELRPVVFVAGILLSVLSVAMLIPAMVDASAGHSDWQVFAASSAIALFLSVCMVLTTRSGVLTFTLRQAFVMTNLCWLMIATVGALPFALCELELSFTDAFFESMSGVTTTGSTVIVGLDNAPPGILMWRAILQWLGGIGIIVMAIAILPILQVGGMQMFRIEAFQTDKVLPKAAQIAGGISIVYISLTAFAAILLWSLGLSGFDAITHAMTSIATGGFSTYDASVGQFDSSAVDWSISLIMLLGSLPFVLYLRVLRGNFRALINDSQVRLLLVLVLLAILATTGWVVSHEIMDISAALRYSTFNVISIITGTGFTTADFGQWGGFVTILFFMLMCIGGCAGSTTCGIKIFRFQVLYATAKTQLQRLMQPHGVFFSYYNRKPISESVAESVMGFFFLFAVTFALLAIGLGMFGLDFITAMSGAATTIANVGPGFGEIIGPAGTFAPLPDGAKWLMSAGMLLGRLELFTVLVLFIPTFWRG